jgi:1-acyl-sn-glycerol-3-phosphate acyltransferase
MPELNKISKGAVKMGLIIAFSLFAVGAASAYSVSSALFARGPFLLALLYFILLLLAGFLAAFLIFYFVQFVISLFLDGDKSAEKPRPYCVWAMEQTAEFICFFCGLRIHVTGEELLPSGTRYLFVSNHRSNLDPIIVMNRLREQQIAFVSKPANMKIPIVGRFIRQCCFLPIDRENARNAVVTINAAADYLKSGTVSVGIYPEGTRSKSTGMGEFHAGSFKIAQKADVPVVVAAVSGTEKAAKRALRRTDVFLDIIAVIPAEQVCAEKTVELAARVKEMLAERLAERDK